jgi:hypothetical protein
MRLPILSLAFSLLTISCAQAWTPVDSKKLCTTTSQAFAMFKKENYQPVIVSQFQTHMVSVWINPQKEILVTNTLSVPGQSESLTCIMTSGTDKTFVDVDTLNELGK